jgi:hypothetical protein
MFHSNFKFRIHVASFFLCVIAASANAAELDISELIAGVKKSISEAQKLAGPPYVIMPWVEGEITYVVKKEGGGGFKFCVVTAEAKYATEAIQRVKFRIEPPPGIKWRVEGPGVFKEASIAGVDYKAMKLFISPPGEVESNLTYAVQVTPDTKIMDTLGKTETLSDLREGAKGTIQYSVGAGAEFKAEVITIKK